MLTSPLIGIPCFRDKTSGYGQYLVNSQYDACLSAISQAGGTPFLIPLNLNRPGLKQLYHMADGIFFTGGGDIEPTLYRQTSQVALYKVQPERDNLEIALSQWAVDDSKPAFGLCRGMQVMAVAVGGSLVQDLPSQMPEATLHNYVYQTEGTNAKNYLAHEVELTATCRLAQILQTGRLWVNSLHHQAVEQVPAPFKIVGTSTDGVAEVFEHPGHPFFCGVQWHPEFLLDKPEARLIFEGFVEACKG